MAQRVQWDIYEAVILLDALLKVQENVISRKDAVEEVSRELRDRATNNGLIIDEVFRNANGISMQMQIMQSVLSEGKTGFKKDNPPKLFLEVVNIYRNDKEAYNRLLEEARPVADISIIRDRFYKWLASEVSSMQLSELYMVYSDISDYCQEQHFLESSLFEVADLDILNRLLNVLQSDKGLKKKYKHSNAKTTSAVKFYIRFIKQNPDLSQFVTQTKNETHQQENVERTGKINENQSNGHDESSQKQSLAFTKPVAYTYFGEKHTDFSNWTELYVSVVNRLWDDFPWVFKTLVNNSISDGGRIDLADAEHMAQMNDAKMVHDNYYLETNLSANNMMDKIKKLLVMCSVDYDNLKVDFIRKRKNNESQPQMPDTVVETEKETTGHKEFIKWALDSGMSKSTIFGYVSAINSCNKAIDRYNIAKNTELFEIKNIEQLSLLREKLHKVPTFVWEPRITSAFKKLIEFRSSYKQLTIASVSEESNKELASEQNKKDDYSEYVHILEKYFSEDGYQPGRVIVRGRFKQYYSGEFEKDIPVSDEEIDNILKQIGVYRNERIFPKSDTSENNLIDEIADTLSEILDNGVSVIYPNAVFERYQGRLAEELQIYTSDAMVSLLSEKENGRFHAKPTYIVKKYGHNNTNEDVVRILKNSHAPLSYDEVREIAWYIPFEKIKSAINSDRYVVSVGKEKVFYALNLPVSGEELRRVTDIIRTELNYHSFITDADLVRLIQKKCPSVAINTEGFTTTGLRNCLKVLIGDNFSFNGAIISPKGSMIDTKEVYAEFAKARESFTFDELKQFSADLEINIYWNTLMRECVRISEYEFIRRDLIDFDAEAIDNVLETMFSGDYAPIKDISLFLHFPNVGYRWNLFLLESYLYKGSKAFSLIHSSFTRDEVYGAIVRNTANIYDYDALVVRVLADTGKYDSGTIAIKYLTDNGYQARKRFDGIENVIKQAKLLNEKKKK